VLATTIPLSIDGMADERWVRLAEQQNVAYAKTVAEAMKLKLDMDNPVDREKLRRTALERHDPTRMPLSRPINHAHPTASDFFENLVIPEKPIPILTLDIAEQMIHSWLDRRMFAVTVNPPGEKGTSDKDRALRAIWTRILCRRPTHSEDAERQDQRANSCGDYEHKSRFSQRKFTDF
jgi:hypothetical protein